MDHIASLINSDVGKELVELWQVSIPSVWFDLIHTIGNITFFLFFFFVSGMHFSLTATECLTLSLTFVFLILMLFVNSQLFCNAAMVAIATT